MPLTLALSRGERGKDHPPPEQEHPHDNQDRSRGDRVVGSVGEGYSHPSELPPEAVEKSDKHLPREGEAKANGRRLTDDDLGMPPQAKGVPPAVDDEVATNPP